MAPPLRAGFRYRRADCSDRPPEHSGPLCFVVREVLYWILPSGGQMGARACDTLRNSRALPPFSIRYSLLSQPASDLHRGVRFGESVRMSPTMPPDARLRRFRGEWGEIAIDKPLSARFTLLIKHNALFAALLPRLTESFPCLALVRNPLSVLASWQTVDLPVHPGPDTGRGGARRRAAPGAGAGARGARAPAHRPRLVLRAVS